MFSPRTLTDTLTVANRGSRTATFEPALRSYLAVSHPAGVEVIGLDGAEVVDRYSGERRAWQPGDVVEPGRSWLAAWPGPVQLVDRSRGRMCTLTARGAAQVVLANPGPEHLPSELSGAGPEAWQQFMRVTIGRVGDDLVRLPAGEQFTLEQQLRLATPEAPDYAI